MSHFWELFLKDQSPVFMFSIVNFTFWCSMSLLKSRFELIFLMVLFHCTIPQLLRWRCWQKLFQENVPHWEVAQLTPQLWFWVSSLEWCSFGSYWDCGTLFLLFSLSLTCVLTVRPDSWRPHTHTLASSALMEICNQFSQQRRGRHSRDPPF